MIDLSDKYYEELDLSHTTKIIDMDNIKNFKK